MNFIVLYMKYFIKLKEMFYTEERKIFTEIIFASHNKNSTQKLL